MGEIIRKSRESFGWSGIRMGQEGVIRASEQQELKPPVKKDCNDRNKHNVPHLPPLFSQHQAHHPAPSPRLAWNLQ